MAIRPVSIRSCSLLPYCWTAMVLCGVLLANVARAGHPNPANVPAALEIEILDPNADPLGNPAVELQRDAMGGFKVDIPRAILVHKLYYTGDRSFQAQFLPGGPVIVVVNHPKTGERCYINVQMFPGAPRVTYTGHKIEYDFGNYGVCIHFGVFGTPKVVYRNGKTWRQHFEHMAAALHHETDEVVAASGVSENLHHAGNAAKNTILASARGIAHVSKVVTTPAQQIVLRTPLAAVFCPQPENQAEHKRAHSLKHVELQTPETEPTIATVR